MTRVRLATLSLGLLLASPVSAQIEFPASWAGIWDITVDERECGSSTIIDSFTEADTLCFGQTFNPGEEEAEFICDGSIDDNGIDITCSATIDNEGCVVTFVTTVVGTKNGDSFSGTETVSITYENCGPIPNQCTESDVSGVRTGSPPAACGTTAVHHVRWSQFKRVYR